MKVSIETKDRQKAAAAVVMVTDGMKTEKHRKQNKRMRDGKYWALCHYHFIIQMHSSIHYEALLLMDKHYERQQWLLIQCAAVTLNVHCTVRTVCATCLRSSG